ncbi:OX-2 membrane glycoprotein-like [Fundulus heteroclitus]|uniref:OX-2 membrane glycoprotein-like n=1 Tax=Fundulus heteroclitus TaxID=8078 RepID=UPI00165A14E1|nr:OX-2 membrane glycoprotein-like [Fundulus heteroclitus]
MGPAFLISWLCMNTVLQTGQLAVIETEEAVWAAVGGQASLSCHLTEDKEVLRITWQKVLPDGEMTFATYAKMLGPRVRAGLEEKMDFQYKDLQSCSMVIRKVTEQDEGCYQCLFKTYPLGALIGRTCLRLYELHGPVLDVSRSSSPAGSVVSCSATGRPAPTVTLTAPQQNLSLSLYNTTRVSNSNGTVTVTTTALLSASSSTQVGCSVSVLSAAPRELLLTVPGPSHTSDHGLDVESGSTYRVFQWCLIAGLVGMLCVAAAFIIVKVENRKSRRLDEDLDSQQSSAMDELLGILDSGDTHRESEDSLDKSLVEELTPLAVTITPDCRRRISEEVKAALRYNFDQVNLDENILTHQSVVKEMKQSKLRSKVEGQ